MNILFKISITLICACLTVFEGQTQIRLIDSKGTQRDVDTSKWVLDAGNIHIKNSGNVGIGVSLPQAKLHTNGSLRFQGLPVSTTNTDLLTVDVDGNINYRPFSSLFTGNGITSINGLTVSTQNFNTGNSGSDFNINSSGSVHTFNIPNASASSRGLLTSSNWTTFNNKQNNITAGTTTQYWRGDKTWQTLNTSVVTEGSNQYFTNARARSSISLTTLGTSGTATYNTSTGVLNIPIYNAGTFTLNGLTNSNQSFTTGITGTDFNISSSGSTHTFNFPDASASSRGLLIASDWALFNNKVSTVSASSPISTSLSGTNVNIEINRHNLLAGYSSNAASIPLTLDIGAMNAIVGAGDATLTVNNTAPLWNANKIFGRNISSTTPTSGQVLKFNGSDWVPSPDAASVNWLFTGNNNAIYNTHFLGTTNDVPMTIRSNNTPMLEVGRRQSLELWDTTNTGLFPYNQQNASVAYVRGTGGNSVLQFECSGANFYKPIFFTDSDGNFQMRGSSAGTDFFELGSTGSGNNGGLLFTIGDDGDEPMIFRKYNYTPPAYIEMLRLQGTGLNNTVRVGVNTGGNIANSTFEVVGSVTTSIVTTNTNLTLNESHYTVIVTADVDITLPDASTCIGRTYIIKKIHNSNSNITTFINTNAQSTNNMTRGVYHLQSDGSDWQRL